MRIIMLAKEKGGCGASTATREIAVIAAAQGHRVAILDLDPQGTTRMWWNRRTTGAEQLPNPSLAVADGHSFKQALGTLDLHQMDFVFIDTPPTANPQIGGMMKVCHHILIPVRPTTDDLCAVPPILDLVEASRVPWSFLITQAPTGRSKLFDEAYQALKQRGRCAPCLGLRTAYPSASAHGQTATELSPNSKAASEIRDLWAFLWTQLTHSPPYSHCQRLVGPAFPRKRAQREAMKPS